MMQKEKEVAFKSNAHRSEED